MKCTVHYLKVMIEFQPARGRGGGGGRRRERGGEEEGGGWETAGAQVVKV